MHIHIILIIHKNKKKNKFSLLNKDVNIEDFNTQLNTQMC